VNKKKKNKITNMLVKKRLGVSPIIVVILLVVITTVFVVILLNWGTSFTGKALDPIDFEKQYETCDYALNITVNSSSNNRVIVRSSYDETLTIHGYSISSKKFADALNKYIGLEEEVSIDKGQSKSLEIYCFPERDFILQLFFEDNCIVSKPVQTTNFNLSECNEYMENIWVPPGVGGTPPYVEEEEPENNYYEIWYLEHLDSIRDDLDGNYKLMKNLDFNNPKNYYSGEINTEWTDGNGWVPIGDVIDLFNPETYNAFTGIFNGNSHTISNVFIYRPTTNVVGLFGITYTGAQIQNLTINNVNYTGDICAGGLIGAKPAGTYSNINVTGNRILVAQNWGYIVGCG